VEHPLPQVLQRGSQEARDMIGSTANAERSWLRWAFLAFACGLALQSATTLKASETQSSKSASAGIDKAESDPLHYLLSDFPGSVTITKKGHLLEFCPDNTCEGLHSSANVPLQDLKDAGYLYIYYFSEYTYLPDWRRHTAVQDAARHILSKHKYQACTNESDRQAARCVLLNLSRNGRINLIFVRYDENRRAVVQLDLNTEITRKPELPE
jgi:hypothetical protein